MAETLVCVENVSKKFCRNLKTGLWYGVQDITQELLGGKAQHCKLRPKEFWAVNDVSFELKRGECLGLVGHNGAGKSTLLKMLNGLIKPDMGRIEMRGRVGALIELGAGFNPILTGRENIYINGAVLGFSKKEIDDKLNEILDFAEIGDFVDTPVQYYSSGMKVRLGFAVAAQMEPDVLILDEVLSVGDAGFKIKSFNRISELLRKSAVIFVSHSMPQVSRVSNKILFMKKGKVEFLGDSVNEGIEAYFNDFHGEQFKVEFDQGAEITDVELYSQKKNIHEQIPKVRYGDSLYLNFDVNVKSGSAAFDVMVQITDKDMKIVGQFLSSKIGKGFVPNGKKSKIRLCFSRLIFIDGEYSITIFLNERNNNDLSKYSILAVYRHIAKFRMEGLGDVLYAPIHLQGKIVDEDFQCQTLSSDSLSNGD